ncbi:uncharacterized protein LOC131257003 isoform X2 [Magnolia sinica]|uniref:uncharacterized protein LOC131257003 isoform X2 n=1 Tax=Magnolia sinica TaxID=86752 RepID=UPI00265B3DBB|nr:uncharacterized protein LOC131257003 isoform X2 [Magnolia sinica]
MRRGFRLPILPLDNAPLLSQARLLCTTPTSNTSNNSKAAAAAAHQEAYRQLQNLDFMTAAKMLFTPPPQKKKFGIDFHLVQLFFACMPSLAVYLVAQYARYEIRRMEAEEEMKKKKAEEEEKAKEVDSNVADEEKSGLELSKVKVRLDALEETVKEIADETKKLYAISTSKDQGGGMKEQSTPTDASLPSKSEGSSSAAEDQNSKSKAGQKQTWWKELK